MNRGIAEFYYTEKLPARAVEIARIQAKPATPSDLTDINNLPQAGATAAGSLTVKTYPIVRSFEAGILGNSVKAVFEGSTYKTFIVENPFFEGYPPRGIYISGLSW